MKNKEYENVFAKMCEHHNNEVVPILRELKLSTIKIRPRRIISLRDTLETSSCITLSIDLFTGYLVSNTYLLNFIDKSELNECYSLIKTKQQSNVLIGISAIYGLIEAKKLEIMEKLK